MSFPSPRVAFTSCDISIGGSSVFLANLGGEIIRRGGESRIFCFDHKNPYAAAFSRLNIPVHTENPRELIFEDRLRSILSHLAAFRPTTVIAALGTEAFEVFRYVPSGVQRVGMIQSDDPLVYQLLDQYAPWLDIAVGVSAHIAEKLAAMPALSRTRIDNLPYGVAFKAPAPLSPPSGEAAPIRILYNGRMDQGQKRVHLFPEIYRRLRTLGIPFAWTLIGEGPLLETLREAMPSQPGAEVRFTGPLPFDHIPDAIHGHDLFLLVSAFEGLPLSLLETMGSGVVPVVSDIPSGVRQVVTPSTGFLIDPAHTPGYADAIAHLHHHRAELAEKSRRCHEAILKKYSIAAMTDRWTEKVFASATPDLSAPWPEAPSILPYHASSRTLYFSPAGQWLRRLGKRIAGRADS